MVVKVSLNFRNFSVISIFLHMHAIFDFIINDNVLENKFLYNPDQKKIIMTLTNTSLENSYLFNEFVCNFGFFWHEWTSLKLE
jgi:hypothetical protein